MAAAIEVGIRCDGGTFSIIRVLIHAHIFRSDICIKKKALECGMFCHDTCPDIHWRDTTGECDHIGEEYTALGRFQGETSDCTTGTISEGQYFPTFSYIAFRNEVRVIPAFIAQCLFFRSFS
ncbi:Protein of unknown function [Pyronema omphalodes CBS 100304]|uniref:Uncharacterized protein n=1 Tax=Pyronema omphalodes (strain CBS 100304) TaxID=1076935 RepID=U4LRC6_PYROM|nr:Protein of unknown function [Pyronema omphalodes CBS 100304]